MSASNEDVGGAGTGSTIQSGGTNSVANNPKNSYLYQGDLNLGRSASGIGTYNLSGNGLLSVSANEYVGNSGTGVFIQSGGTNVVGNSLYVGCRGDYGNSGDGVYSLSGIAQLSASNEYVGYLRSGTRPSGVFTQSGGTNTVSAGLYVGGYFADSGVYNLSGGVLILAGLYPGSGAGLAAFNFSGGTLRASSQFSSSMSMTLGAGGGATFDTAGYAVALAGSLSGPGSLTKLGAGTLVLSGSNTYNGGTFVTAGLLELTKSAALPDGTGLTVGANAVPLFNGAAVPAGSPTAVPEPSTIALLGLGLVSLIATRFRRASSRSARYSGPGNMGSRRC
jgi:autotransporter-associated beta strand protein